MSRKWHEKLGSLLNGNPKRRRQLMVILGVSFVLVAILEAVAPEWATAIFDVFMFFVSLV